MTNTEFKELLEAKLLEQGLKTKDVEVEFSKRKMNDFIEREIVKAVFMPLDDNHDPFVCRAYWSVDAAADIKNIHKSTIYQEIAETLIEEYKEGIENEKS